MSLLERLHGTNCFLTLLLFRTFDTSFDATFATGSRFRFTLVRLRSLYMPLNVSRYSRTFEEPFVIIIMYIGTVSRYWTSFTNVIECGIISFAFSIASLVRLLNVTNNKPFSRKRSAQYARSRDGE